MACTQAELKEFTQEEGSAAYTHIRLINESSAALTNLSHPVDSCIGRACKAGLSVNWACVTVVSEYSENKYELLISGSGDCPLVHIIPLPSHYPKPIYLPWL